MDYAVPAPVADGSRNANGQAVHFIKTLLLIYSLIRHLVATFIKRNESPTLVCGTSE